MEQGQGSVAVATPENMAPAEPVQPKNNKNKIGMIVCIVCLAVLAVAGLTFGAYAMATKDAAVAEATANCGGGSPAPSQGGASESAPEDAPEVNEVTCPDGTTVEVEVPSIANPSEYIIIGSWGIKIKIPSDLVSVSYSYDVGAGFTRLGVLGAKRGGQYFPEFADPQYNRFDLGTVIRLPEDYKDEWYTGENAVLTLDGYKYYYAHPQDVYSTDKDEAAWEVESTELIRTMLQNASNYSRI